jgi:hypothetical protein
VHRPFLTRSVTAWAQLLRVEAWSIRAAAQWVEEQHPRRIDFIGTFDDAHAWVRLRDLTGFTLFRERALLEWAVRALANMPL